MTDAQAAPQSTWQAQGPTPYNSRSAMADVPVTGRSALSEPSFTSVGGTSSASAGESGFRSDSSRQQGTTSFFGRSKDAGAATKDAAGEDLSYKTRTPQSRGLWYARDAQGARSFNPPSSLNTVPVTVATKPEPEQPIQAAPATDASAVAINVPSAPPRSPPRSPPRERSFGTSGVDAATSTQSRDVSASQLSTEVPVTNTFTSRPLSHGFSSPLGPSRASMYAEEARYRRHREEIVAQPLFPRETQRSGVELFSNDSFPRSSGFGQLGDATASRLGGERAFERRYHREVRSSFAGSPARWPDTLAPSTFPAIGNDAASSSFRNEASSSSSSFRNEASNALRSDTTSGIRGSTFPSSNFGVRGNELSTSFRREEASSGLRNAGSNFRSIEPFNMNYYRNRNLGSSDLALQSGFQDSLVGRTESRSMLGACDIEENANGMLMRIDAPGMTHEDIKVSLGANNMLTVSGERLREHEEASDTIRRHERYHGRFSRTFTLPARADADRIACRLDHGVLKVEVPYQQQSSYGTEYNTYSSRMDVPVAAPQSTPITHV